MLQQQQKERKNWNGLAQSSFPNMYIHTVYTGGIHSIGGNNAASETGQNEASRLKFFLLPTVCIRICSHTRILYVSIIFH